MEIKSFRIRNYRSIKDSGVCHLSGDDITILAGKNESGKTAILEALEDFAAKKQIRDEAIPLDDPESKPEISIALNQQQDVKLAFHTVTALQGARITIQIPENVALAGYPGQRELSWETNLNEGENLLRLPLVASQSMKGQLVARIEHGKRVRTLRVNLKAGIPGVSGQGVLIEQLV